jgi:hypothetical protein
MVNPKLKLENHKIFRLRLKKNFKSPTFKKTRLTKSWMAGFIDGEGSFALEKVDFSKSSRPNSKSFIRPILSISQNDPQLLYKIRDYFGCGKVTRKSKKAWHFRCRNHNDFRKFIIPRLKNAPFQTIKQYQLELIRDEAMPLLGGSSPTKEKELLKILGKIQDSRKNLCYTTQNPIDFDWFLGFFEGEGNFTLKVKQVPKNSIRISFKVSQKNKNVLDKIQAFWKFGKVQSEGYTRKMWKYSVEGIKNVSEYGIKIFENHSLKGKKNLERAKFLKAIQILLKQEGFVTYYSKATMEQLDKLEKGIHEVRLRIQN